MVRAQIQLTERQAAVLKQVALERHTSMAAVIREAVDVIVERADYMAKRERAIAAIGRFSSGLPDVAIDHDRYLDEAYSSWRRSPGVTEVDDPEGRVPAFYERPGLNSEVYDMRTADEGSQRILEGDVELYLTLAREVGGPVLDLGGGTGRVSVPLARAGFEVVNLDLSASMQATGRTNLSTESAEVAARVRFVPGDMNDFDLAMEFGLVVIGFRSFQVLLEPAQQQGCLAAVRRHLRPGGLLAFHVFDPLLDRCAPTAAASGSVDRGGVRHPVSGNLVQMTVLERKNDPLRQQARELWEFRELDAAGGVLRREQEVLTMRWTYRHEMRYLLELAGLQVRSESSDFRGSPPAYGMEQVWVAQRPADFGALFDLGESGGSDIARHKDRYISEAMHPD